jgi:hypothetical protein
MNRRNSDNSLQKEPTPPVVQAAPPMRQARHTRFITPEPTEPSEYSRHSLYVPNRSPPAPPSNQPVPQMPVQYQQQEDRPPLAHQASWDSGSSGHSNSSRMSSISRSRGATSAYFSNSSKDPLFALAPPVPARLNPYAPEDAGGEEHGRPPSQYRIVNQAGA